MEAKTYHPGDAGNMASASRAASQQPQADIIELVRVCHRLADLREHSGVLVARIGAQADRLVGPAPTPEAKPETCVAAVPRGHVNALDLMIDDIVGNVRRIEQESLRLERAI